MSSFNTTISAQVFYNLFDHPHHYHEGRLSIDHQELITVDQGLNSKHGARGLKVFKPSHCHPYGLVRFLWTQGGTSPRLTRDFPRSPSDPSLVFARRKALEFRSYLIFGQRDQQAKLALVRASADIDSASEADIDVEREVAIEEELRNECSMSVDPPPPPTPATAAAPAAPQAESRAAQAATTPAAAAPPPPTAAAAAAIEHKLAEALTRVSSSARELMLLKAQDTVMVQEMTAMEEQGRLLLQQQLELVKQTTEKRRELKRLHDDIGAKEADCQQLRLDSRRLMKQCLEMDEPSCDDREANSEEADSDTDSEGESWVPHTAKRVRHGSTSI